MFGSEESHKMIKPNSRRRVLKPPGGGSSDIFGASSDHAEPQRKNRSHLTSSIFGGEDTVTPARNKAGNDSFYNLFGAEPHSRPVSAIKDKFISNINLDQNQEHDVKKSINFCEKDETSDQTDSTTTATLESLENSKASGENNGLSMTNDSEEAIEPDSQSPVDQDGLTSNIDEKPVTSETPSVNGTSTTNSAASTTAPTPTAPASATTKTRVPPGGFSSGLW